MPQFKNKVTGELVTAHQWFKNGDHPDDYAQAIQDYERGQPMTYSQLYQRLHDWEGQVVRRYNRPDVDGQATCPLCLQPYCDHGFLDNPVGVVVHPSDWVVRGEKGTTAFRNAYFFSNFDLVEASP